MSKNMEKWEKIGKNGKKQGKMEKNEENQVKWEKQKIWLNIEKNWEK